MQHKLIPLGLLIVAFVLGLAIVLNPGAASASPASAVATPTMQPGTLLGPPPPSATGAPAPLTGMPAIRTMPGMAANQAGTQGSTKPISRDDVITYTKQYGMPHSLSGSSVATVTRADILTSKVISQLLHGETTGLADGKQLWFVTMQGTFKIAGSPHSPTITASIGYEVFDPETGSLYMWGTLG